MPRVTLLVVLLALVGPVVGRATHAQPSARPGVEQTLSEARTYLDQYRSDLAFILADEQTTQRITRQTPIVQGAPTSRRTKAEVYFKYVDIDNTWMAIREFVEVDGHKVDSQPDLKAALQSQGLAQVARTFKTFNSQFNIGRIYRNFNEPTLALGVLELDRGPQFEFSHKGTRRANGLTLITLAFREQPGPNAFVYNLDMKPASIEGEIVIEQGTGRIHKTLLEIQMASVKAVLTTEYTLAESVNLLVPTVFREQYESGVNHSGSAVLNFGSEYESIFCDSRYTKFRQFKTTSRIK
jgi:hypothetical protein